MFTVLWAKTLCLYNVTVCVSLPMRAEAVSSHLFLRSVNHYTLSGVCEKRWRRNQAGGRLRRFHLPLSLTLSTLYSFTHSLSSLSLSLSLSHTHKGNSTGVSRLRLVAWWIYWHTKHNETTAWQPPAQSFAHTQTQSGACTSPNIPSHLFSGIANIIN